MAYQPKFAKNSPKTEKTRPVTPQPEHREPEQTMEPEKKKGITVRFVLFVLLGFLVVPASCWATFHLMSGVLENVGRPKAVQQTKAANMAILDQLDVHVADRVTAARNHLLAVDHPEYTPETEPEETLPPVRKLYWIEDDAMVAPEPKQECYGETDDPSPLQWLLDEAKWILDGQELYFSTEAELFEGSKVMYYLDDSIFAITWKEVHEGSVYTFSEVKVTHPSQFRRHLAGGEYGSDYQYKTTEMAESVNAVVASSGDFYRFRDFGAVVYRGEAKRVEGTYAETCYIDSNGDMHFTYGGEVLTVEDVQAFVDEHDIQFSLAFGPILVDNYELVEHSWYGVGEITEEYARAALCQMDNLHYIVVTANTEGPNQGIPTVARFQKYVAATGCRMAYSLDGGQTAAIVMNDQLINRPVYGEQRKISDIIYFATAVPEEG